MRTPFSLFLLVLMGFALVAGCGRQDEGEADASAFALTVDGLAERRPVVRGTASLPDSTLLVVTVRRVRGARVGEQRAVLLGGRFESQPFGPEAGLEDGDYVAYVDVLAPATQPAAVQTELGEQASLRTETSFVIGAGDPPIVPDTSATPARVAAPPPAADSAAGTP